jgi:hypothetical protein
MEMRGSGADVWLYRGQEKLYGEGTDLGPEDWEQYEEGRIVHWRAFTSTGTYEDTARVFAQKGKPKVRTLFRIQPRDGVPNLGAILKPLSKYENEEETLLPPGSAFQVLRREIEPGGDEFRVITLKYVGDWVSEKVFEGNLELQRERAQELNLVRQLTAMEAYHAQQSWAHAHPEVDITGEGSALAKRTGDDDAADATWG